ncbi:hypothetical protein GUITHDRAFT_143251 [Guillardia theta CCMP2712]|uniref:C2H2-type domain-containing protein n=1 Tax=Guillardia theta (strain CCMP2712) TaxID=905079 RepID=L1IVH1_GUITC|nr:hypothetical protein GUITHDRAFT_143251 [Guillardia theta CCMP2712]EKX39879.1 hypothetical protein GUITHDRAFT_143251 [Guillardia theta CCMP2712]|eukprot:XP_005826859.1 hypothetical protein GUITHDRAFT_143251 [Guillardia theta CCMP2712]
MPPSPPFLTRALVRSSLPIASLSRHVHRSRVTFTHLDGTPGPLHQAPRHVLSSLWHVQGVLGCSGRRATGDRWATTGAGAEKGKETTVQVVMSTKTPSAGGVGSAAAEESSNKERGEAGDGAEAGAGKTGVEAVSTTASPSAGGKGESPRKEEKDRKSKTGASTANVPTSKSSPMNSKRLNEDEWKKVFECPTCRARFPMWKKLSVHLKRRKHILRGVVKTWKEVKELLQVLFVVVLQIVDMLRNIYRMHDIDKPPKLTRMDRDTRLPKKKGKVQPGA